MKTRFLDSLAGGLWLAAFVVLLLERTAVGMAYSPVLRWINVGLFSAFLLDALARFLPGRARSGGARLRFPEVFLIAPIMHLLAGYDATPVQVLTRQAAIVIMALSRARQAGRFLNLFRMKPAQIMVAGYLFAIGCGAVLLTLPAATVDGVGMSCLDALFTSTSATCVTGLVVRDTAMQVSVFGQCVILALVQIGGLGLMTFSVTIALALRQAADVKRQALMLDILDQDALAGVKQLMVFIVAMTAAIEFVGGLALTGLWWGRFDSAADTVFHAFFHSVSAFCNAGFSTFTDSLMGFRGDVGAQIAVCLLIVLGGLGFPVVFDCFRLFRNRLRGPIRGPSLRVQSRVVLLTGLLLTFGGALLLFLFEAHAPAAARAPLGDRCMTALFQSVTARTAGFNTVDVAALSAPSLLILTALMFIGGAPGSTAGGIKTTTLAVLWATAVSQLRGREQTEFFRRTVPAETVKKAVSLLLLSLSVVLVFALLLMYVENRSWVEAGFETVSAFGTVGLSTGITPRLSAEGKTLVTVLMFVGRLGPLTLAYAFARRRSPARYEYAEERVMIG